MTPFMERGNRELLKEGAKTFGIHLEEKTIETFALYLRELLKWNQKINLTAIRSERGVVLKHFLDSLSVVPFLPELSSLLDMGSGAGFPGIPLKIVRPELEITLIDSVRKKVDFQRHILRLLGLKGIEAIHGRVQDKAILQNYQERFDGVIARAFCDLRTLLGLSLPFLKERGVVMAMKGRLRDKEIERLTEGDVLSYRLKKTVSFNLPFSSLQKTLLLFEKQ